jgi:hypothetical protein
VSSFRLEPLILKPASKPEENERDSGRLKPPAGQSIGAR